MAAQRTNYREKPFDKSSKSAPPNSGHGSVSRFCSPWHAPFLFCPELLVSLVSRCLVTLGDLWVSLRLLWISFGGEEANIADFANSYNMYEFAFVIVLTGIWCLKTYFVALRASERFKITTQRPKNAHKAVSCGVPAMLLSWRILS